MKECDLCLPLWETGVTECILIMVTSLSYKQRIMLYTDETTDKLHGS
jgi:hypothetical protein